MKASRARIAILLCFFQLGGFLAEFGDVSRSSDAMPLEPEGADSGQDPAGDIPDLTPDQLRIVRALMKQKEGHVAASIESEEEASRLPEGACSWNKLFSDERAASALEANAARMREAEKMSVNTYSSQEGYDTPVSSLSEDKAINLKNY